MNIDPAYHPKHFAPLVDALTTPPSAQPHSVAPLNVTLPRATVAPLPKPAPTARDKRKHGRRLRIPKIIAPPVPEARLAETALRAIEASQTRAAPKPVTDPLPHPEPAPQTPQPPREPKTIVDVNRDTQNQDLPREHTEPQDVADGGVAPGETEGVARAADTAQQPAAHDTDKSDRLAKMLSALSVQEPEGGCPVAVAPPVPAEKEAGSKDGSMSKPTAKRRNLTKSGAQRRADQPANEDPARTTTPTTAVVAVGQRSEDRAEHREKLLEIQKTASGPVLAPKTTQELADALTRLSTDAQQLAQDLTSNPKKWTLADRVKLATLVSTIAGAAERLGRSSGMATISTGKLEIQGAPRPNAAPGPTTNLMIVLPPQIARPRHARADTEAATEAAPSPGNQAVIDLPPAD